MENYPTSLDTGVSLPTPSATDDTNSPSLSGLNGSQNNAIIALETKLGITASTPTAGMLLRSTADGESTWDLPYPASETFVGLTDIQTLTNKTIDASNNTITNLTGADLASQSITANQIANATITANQIANATITANQIANNTITDTQMATGSLNKIFITQSSTATAGSPGSTPALWNAWPSTYTFSAITGHTYNIRIVEPSVSGSASGAANYDITLNINGTDYSTQQSVLFTSAGVGIGVQIFEWWWQPTGTGSVTLVFYLTTTGTAQTYTWTRTSTELAFLIVNDTP